MDRSRMMLFDTSLFEKLLLSHVIKVYTSKNQEMDRLIFFTFFFFQPMRHVHESKGSRAHFRFFFSKKQMGPLPFRGSGGLFWAGRSVVCVCGVVCVRGSCKCATFTCFALSLRCTVRSATSVPLENPAFGGNASLFAVGRHLVDDEEFLCGPFSL